MSHRKDPQDIGWRGTTENMPSTEIQKWGDAAQYRSEVMPFNVNEGPRVTLVNATPDPLGSIAAMCGIYEGKVFRSLDDVTDEQRAHYWEQLQKTHLKAPLEAVQLHFLIEGVTRSFTHQMVRQRTACYAQESLRFAVKEHLDEEIPLPPSLAGLTDKDPRVRVWRKGVNAVDDAYSFLVHNGVPAEEARGLLPHSVTTRIHYITNLRGLLEHAGNRLCTQAQFEWRLVLAQLKKALHSYAEVHELEVGGWAWHNVAKALKPICYATGKCEFKASFDRACSIRERVDANEAIGRPSSSWSEDLIPGDPSPDNVRAIRDWEWLADPSAARS